MGAGRSESGRGYSKLLNSTEVGQRNSVCHMPTCSAHIFQSHSAVRFVDSYSKFISDSLDLMCKHFM